MQETDESSTEAVKDAATAWFVRLRDEPLSDNVRRAFEDWRDAETTNADAYREIERLWSGLDQIDRRSVSRSVRQNVANPSAGSALRGRRLTWRRMATAASLVIVVFAGILSQTQPGILADYRTGIGEQRSIVLADGSTAQLDASTMLSVNFDADRRSTTLHGGEAYFDLATEPARPFVVDAGVGRVEALGTAFSVERRNGVVDVVVTESKVIVSDRRGRTAVVAAGQGVRITSAGLGSVALADALTALAWRRERLVFDNRPLGEVLDELQRYRRGRIVILDDELSALPVTGSFALSDTDATLETIERALPIRLYRLSDWLILVDARPAR